MQTVSNANESRLVASPISELDKAADAEARRCCSKFSLAKVCGTSLAIQARRSCPSSTL